MTGLALDREGYLWISTRDGLARYDGVGYRVYRHVPGDAGALPGNFVQTVFVDRGNRVWVGVEGQGLSVLDRGAHAAFATSISQTRPLMRSDDVWAITADARWRDLVRHLRRRAVSARSRSERMTRFLPAPATPPACRRKT